MNELGYLGSDYNYGTLESPFLSLRSGKDGFRSKRPGMTEVCESNGRNHTVMAIRSQKLAMTGNFVICGSGSKDCLLLSSNSGWMTALVLEVLHLVDRKFRIKMERNFESYLSSF